MKTLRPKSSEGNQKRKTADRRKNQKSKSDAAASDKAVSVHQIHEFVPGDAEQFTSRLLKWYNSSKRDLPWRSISTDLSLSDRAYAILVSEVMLQQTQVVTVLQYYAKWMACWPTFSHLAQASLDDVNRVWSGMGYYSRAKRLWEAAKMVTFQLDGKAPQTSKDLQEKLPGVGRYTAGAVASIAFGEKVPAVDGNVVRVLSRVRCIGADCTSKGVMDHVWNISDQLVSEEQPGNFNQAMMDLGATICTPKKPSCNKCPVSQLCHAYQQVQKNNPLKELQLAKQKLVEDIEDVPCKLCLQEPWDVNLGVMNFPRKSKKASPRNEVSLVCIIFKSENCDNQRFLLSQRPQGGLLGGLWEFPNVLISGPRPEDVDKEMTIIQKEILQDQWGLDKKSICSPTLIAVVPHIFSHIHKLYIVYCAELPSSSQVVNNQNLETKWMTAEEISSAAISTAMKKVFLVFSNQKVITHPSKKRPRSMSKQPASEGTSKKMTDFFGRTSKK